MRGGWTVAAWVLAGVPLVAGEPVVELAPVVVEAWHFDRLGAGVPAGVERLERVEIAASGAGSVPELLAGLGGVRFAGYAGGSAEGQLAMRGFGENSGLRVLVLVDGQPYNPPDMSGIGWAGLEVGDLETVEVLRGGQTVLYGNHAVSGVVKLRTREPGEDLEGRLAVEAGGNGHRKVAGGAGQGFGRWGVRAGGSWWESDGYRANAAAEARTGQVAWNARGAGGGRFGGRISSSASSIQFPGPLSWEQMMEDPRQSRNSGDEIADTEETQATLHGEGDAGWGQWQFQSGLLERRRDWSLSGTAAGSRHRRGSLSPRLKWEAGDGFVMAGADCMADRVDYTDFLPAQRGVVRALAEVERITAGGYLFGSQALAGGLTLSAGLRAEAARTDNLYVHYRGEQLLPVMQTNRGTVPNPAYRNPPEPDPSLSFEGPSDSDGWAAEVSLLKEVRDGLSLWCGWDRVYRYPSLDETASYQGYPLSDPLNTGLRPETGDNFEAGIKRLGANWHADLTLFLLRMRDEIAFDEEARLNVNIGDTERRGAEFALEYRRARYGAALSGSWTRARLREAAPGAVLPLVPEYEAGVAAWVRPVQAVRLQARCGYLSGQYQGNDYANVLRPLPGRTLVDLAVQWEPREGLTAALAVTNLFDKTHAATAYSGGFYPGAGRSATFRLGYAF